MHAWEAIQKTINYIEDHIGDDMQIDELAEIASLSLFYYQRLFTRLVNMSVRDYIKLRRLALAANAMRDTDANIVDIAMDYGFGSHETFTRAFKEAYGITPSKYRKNSISLESVDKPDLLLNHVIVDENVPLISEEMILEMSRQKLEQPIYYVGIADIFPFHRGKMAGERSGIDIVGDIWKRFYEMLPSIPHDTESHMTGNCYWGHAPAGYSTYFAGVEVSKQQLREAVEGKLRESALGDEKRPTDEKQQEACTTDGKLGEFFNIADNIYCDPERLARSSIAIWKLPVREYVVCRYEVEQPKNSSLCRGKAMRYTRFWLKKHGLIADNFFPERYYEKTKEGQIVELWIPFKERSE